MQWLHVVDFNAWLAQTVHAIRSAETGIYIPMVIVAGLGLLFVFLALGWFVYAGQLSRRSPVPMSQLTEGYHLVQGQAREPMLAAPLTGRPCVWWQIRVWEAVAQKNSNNDSDGAVWEERRHEVSTASILCVQGLTGCALPSEGISLAVPSEVRLWEGTDPEPQDRNPPVSRGDIVMQGYPRTLSNYRIYNGQLLRDNRWRYAEEIILPGSTLYALGRVRRVTAELDPSQAPPAPWRMDPAAASLRQPYVVSALPPEEIHSKLGHLGRVLATIGMVLLVLVALVLWVRLSGT